MRNDDPAAIMATTQGYRSMADGTLRISFDVRPADSIDAIMAFGGVGATVAIARLTNEAGLEADRRTIEAEGKGPWGQLAKDLLLKGFFRVPAVWAAIGTDEDYIDWVRLQPSAKSGRFSFYNNGEGRCIPAHVRHLEHGGGTGLKPPYSCIPLTNDEHALAHQKGDDELGSRGWWDQQRIHHLQLWAREVLKHHLGHDSWTWVAPSQLLQWCKAFGLEQYLPANFDDYLNQEGEDPCTAISTTG